MPKFSLFKKKSNGEDLSTSTIATAAAGVGTRMFLATVGGVTNGLNTLLDVCQTVNEDPSTVNIIKLSALLILLAWIFFSYYLVSHGSKHFPSKIIRKSATHVKASRAALTAFLGADDLRRFIFENERSATLYFGLACAAYLLAVQGYEAFYNLREEKTAFTTKDIHNRILKLLDAINQFKSLKHKTDTTPLLSPNPRITIQGNNIIKNLNKLNEAIRVYNLKQSQDTNRLNNETLLEEYIKLSKNYTFQKDMFNPLTDKLKSFINTLEHIKNITITRQANFETTLGLAGALV